MKTTVYTLNAFAKEENGGNPAGVVLNADALTESQMQRIAAKVGFSETAFIQKSTAADFKVSFFTPTAQVDLCGHATIAALYLLAQKEILKPGRYTQETKAGLLPVEISPEHIMVMNQNKPVFYETISKSELADSLNVGEDCFVDTLPAQIVSTGLKDIMVPVSTLEQLLRIKPDFNKVADISKKYHVVGYHLFTLETIHSSTAHCRNLAPLYDIPEEAATGTSSGALSCYLYRHGILSEEAASHLVFEQGYSMGRPSEIFAQLVIQNHQISEVRIGGTARDLHELEI